MKEKMENRLILTLSGAAAENGGSGIWQIHYHWDVHICKAGGGLYSSWDLARLLYAPWAGGARYKI